MKLDKNSGKEVKMSQQIKREKSADPKEILKQEKQQKEKEKKEKEKQEKERKEREKKEKERLEKERKEREKQAKKGMALPPSLTTSEINKIGRPNDQSNLNQSSNTGIPNSKSENVLNKFKKQTSILSSNSSKNSNIANTSTNNKSTLQQPLIPKGRFRCQVVYLDESVKTFELDVSFLDLIKISYTKS